MIFIARLLRRSGRTRASREPSRNYNIDNTNATTTTTTNNNDNSMYAILGYTINQYNTIY